MSRFLDVADVAVEILKTADRDRCARELPRIAFGATFDDGLEPLDLSLAVIDGCRDVAHQTLQKLRIGREIGEIEVHPMVLEHAES
ncbi:hypothetical protein [Bradyrhizobium sp. HKCCYLS20291]|uniref:hypothetical protein n=1 Tax=Bradyrhizobium sp. HKCCYLS20291 TaxID=3420766 RepID=UPI003EBAB92A